MPDMYLYHGDCLIEMSKILDRSIDLILCRHTLEYLPTEYNIEFFKECALLCF